MAATRTTFKKTAISDNQDSPKPSGEIPPPQVPMAVARWFVAQHCMHAGTLTLRHWRGGWWQWRKSHWSELEERAVRSLLYTFTEHAFYLKEENPTPWAPTRRKIGDLLDALAVICILPTDLDQPAWLDGRTTGMIVAVGNGLLDLGQRRLIPHTPLFFNQTSVPFDYQQDAPEPRRWLTFLETLWPTEPEAINVLGEWFGYVV